MGILFHLTWVLVIFTIGYFQVFYHYSGRGDLPNCFLQLIVFLQLPVPGASLSLFSVVSLVLRQSRRS